MHVVTLTIDHTKVAGDLTDYVVAVVNNSDAGWADLYAAVTEGGGDIRVFKSDDTTELAREIVSFSASAETGEIYIKFSGTLSSSVDTDIHIYADGTSSDYAVGATYGRNAVWSDYVAVFHMQVSSSPLVNSTGGDTLSATGTPTYSVAGKIDDGISTPGGSTASYHANDSGVTGATTTTPISLQCWGYPTSGGNFGGGNSAVYVGGGTSNHEHGIQFFSSGISAVTQGNSADTQARGASISANTWYMAHAVFSSTSNRKYYQNGTLAATNTTSNTVNAGSKVRVGSRYNITSQNFQGTLDEVRIRNSELSANWITTEYNNQNSPSTFYSVATATTPNVTVTPAAQSITASIPAYSVLKSVTQTPSAQVLTSSIPAYEVVISHVATPAAQGMTLSVPVYVIDAGGNITLAVNAQVLTVSIPTYGLVFDKIVEVNTQVATLSIPAYSIDIGTAAVITPDAQSATLTIPAYSVTAQRSIIIEILSQVLTLSLPTLGKVGGVWTKRARATDSTWSRRSVNND